MKKLFSILSAAVIVLSVAAVMAFAVGDGKNRGDVNGDGKVDSADAMLVMKCDAGLLSLSNDEIKRADLNGDGKIDSCDAVYILRIAAGAQGSRCRDYGREYFPGDQEVALFRSRYFLPRAYQQWLRCDHKA